MIFFLPPFNNCEYWYILQVANGKALRRELHFHKTLQKDADAAKVEARNLKKKLKELQDVQSVINGGFAL